MKNHEADLLGKRSIFQAMFSLRSTLDFKPMARTKTPANIVGPQIQQQRNRLGLTQEEFAARCQLNGLDISRGTLSQIEARLRCVTDDELLALALTLDVSTDSLFPTATKKRRQSQ